MQETVELLFRNVMKVNDLRQKPGSLASMQGLGAEFLNVMVSWSCKNFLQELYGAATPKRLEIALTVIK